MDNKKLRLDSIVSGNGIKIGNYSYDTNGKNIKSDDLTIIYDSVGNLVTIKEADKIRDEFTYYSNGEILTWVRYGNLNNGPWSPMYKSKYLYDTNQNKKTIMTGKIFLQ